MNRNISAVKKQSEKGQSWTGYECTNSIIFKKTRKIFLKMKSEKGQLRKGQSENNYSFGQEEDNKG